jgi:hypothetical protein
MMRVKRPTLYSLQSIYDALTAPRHPRSQHDSTSIPRTSRCANGRCVANRAIALSVLNSICTGAACAVQDGGGHNSRCRTRERRDDLGCGGEHGAARGKVVMASVDGNPVSSIDLAECAL